MAEMIYRYTFFVDVAEGQEPREEEDDILTQITRTGPIPLHEGDFVELGPDSKDNQLYMVQAVFARLFDDMGDEVDYWVSLLEMKDEEEEA